MQLLRRADASSRLLPVFTIFLLFFATASTPTDTTSAAAVAAAARVSSTDNHWRLGAGRHHHDLNISSNSLSVTTGTSASPGDDTVESTTGTDSLDKTGRTAVSEERRRLDSDAQKTPDSRRRTAYATLLYSDFIHGTRALGQSLRESGTEADTVVLVTPDVSAETRERLAQDGWIVRPVEVKENPNQNFQSRLVFVYTKLLIVEMEDEYDRIVFMDADTLVLENIDELFECSPFCAVMRHSELLNSGVVVITPSKELYNHMHDLIGKLDSYTGGDQGFLNSFFPYFAACPAFEPYDIVGSNLAGVGSGHDHRLVLRGGAGIGEGLDSAMVPETRTAKRKLAVSDRAQGWGCKRLPTRYNGDWPLLFVDGDLQVVQGKEAGPEAPADWKRRKKVKVLHFTFGTAKPWNWWTYPFLPYVDLWLEAFHRVEHLDHARRLGYTATSGGGDAAGTGKKEKRPRWNGVAAQVVWGLAPLAMVAIVWRAVKRWNATSGTLSRMGMAFARYTVPPKALNARSLLGSIYNLAVGLGLAISAAIMAFKAVPATQLGAARPEAAWAFFWGRATALMVLFEGFYLLLIWLKAHQVFAPVPVEDGAPYASISPGMPADYDGSLLAQGNSAVGIGGRRAGSLSGGVTDAMAKQAGRSVGAMCSARRRLALTETVAHLVFLSAMAASLVSAPLWVGLNGFPASREVLPGLARLLGLLVAFTFSAVRLPPVWGAHSRAWHRKQRGRRITRGDRREMEVERAALGNLSPLSDHHSA